MRWMRDMQQTVSYNPISCSFTANDLIRLIGMGAWHEMACQVACHPHLEKYPGMPLITYSRLYLFRNSTLRRYTNIKHRDYLGQAQIQINTAKIFIPFPFRLSSFFSIGMPPWHRHAKPLPDGTVACHSNISSCPHPYSAHSFSFSSERQLVRTRIKKLSSLKRL